MKNNCLKHLFTALLLLYAMVVSAHDFEVDGIYYNILSEEEKTVEVTYGGDYSDSYSNEYTGSVVIPESVTYNGTTYSVTSIGKEAFSGCIWLRSITIPNSVTSIGEFAFSVCFRLTSVTIPNSVTSIGGYAFYSCTGLTSITIPNSVTSIGDDAFDECTGLKEVHISDLVAWCNIDFGRYSSNPMCCAHNLYLNGELVTELVIPEDVTKINGYAFYGCTGLTSVTIPNSVTSIGFEAFDGCTGLTSVTIPNSVTIIGNNAFNGCTELKEVHISDLVAWCNIYFARYSGNPMCCAHNLYLNGELVTELVIPEDVTEIKEYAFYGCTCIRSVVIGNGVASIGDEAFHGCTGLTSIVVDKENSVYDSRDNCNAIIETKTNTLIAGCKNTVIPNSVTSIGYYAFEDCSSLTSITIPNSVTSIGNYAFDGCTGLTSIEIPNSVTSIENYAFYGCSSLTNITIPNSVTSIGSGAFRDCSGLTSVTIPNSVTTIGSEAFRDCTGLTSITIPNSVTSIGGSTFENCSSLTSIEIPNSVTSIGGSAFENCSSLTNITIPNSVTSIGGWAFDGCTGLTSIYLLSIVPPSISSNSFSYTQYKNAVLYVPQGTLATYQVADNWKNFTNITELVDEDLEFTITSEEDATVAVTGYSGNKSTVAIPSHYTIDGKTYTVTSIGSSAFRGCTGLTSITIPNSVTSIGGTAFRGCTGLTSVTIPNSVTSIGNYAFSRCTGLTSVTIPNSVTSIGSGAFSDCTGLTSITIPNSVTSIGGSTFENCSSLTNITIPNSVTSIGGWAFDGCSSLTSITIPNSVTSIGNKAFSGCTGLTSITIPNSVTNIGESAFANCTGLTSVNFNAENCTSMGSSSFPVFKGSTALSTVTIGENVKNIPDYAFENCYGLTSVTIPNSVTSIGSYAFRGCTGLTSVVIGNSVTSIGYGAFSRCTGLTSVEFNAESCTRMGEQYTPPVFSGCRALSTVTIGEAVKTIPKGAFSGCTGLTSVISYIPTENLFTLDDFCDFEVYLACTLYVPKGAKEKYASTHQWDFFGDIVEINIPGITINRKTVILTEGETSTLVTIVIIDGVADEDIIWSTSNSAVATVESGLVTAIAPGSATITATVGGYSDSCVVTVAVPITSLSELNNNTVYHICQPHHSKGATSWAVERGGDKLRSNVDLGIELDSDDPRQQFAILSDDGGNTYFLYHVTESKFICKDGSLSETPVDAIKFMEGAYSDTFFAYFDNAHYVNVGGSQQMLIDGWSTPDGGNSCLIQHVGEFDPTEALEAIHNFTGIDDVKAKSGEENGIYYDLNGRAVENPANGIYIIDGKKVLVK